MKIRTATPVMIQMLECRRLMSASITAPAFSYGTVWQAEADLQTVVTPVIQSSPVKFALQNAPRGMTINASTGTIGWTPTESQVGNYQLTVIGSNSAGATDASIAINVAADVPMLFYELNFNGYESGNPYAVVGTPMNVYVINDAATPGKLTVVSGPKNAALVASGVDGLIGWTPGPADAGTASFTVQSKNIYGTTQLKIQFPVYATPPVSNIAVKTSGLIAPTLSWTPPPVAKGENIAGYNIQLAAFGPTGVTNYSFDRSNSATSFQLQGLPKGDYDFFPTITPLNVAGQPGVPATGVGFAYAGSSPLNVPAAQSIVTGQSLNVTVNEAWTGYFPVFGLISGPKGLSIDPVSGQIHWVPASNQTGTYNVAFSATSILGTFKGSMQISVTFPVPGSPTSIQITHATSTGFNLSWAAPANNADLVTGYNIYIDYAPNDSNDASEHVSYTVPANIFKFDFTALILGEFDVQVVGFDAQGVEGPSSGWYGAGTSW